MAGRKTNKVIISIGFLLVLIGGLLVNFVLADEYMCLQPTSVTGYVNDTSGDPIRGVNVTAYSGNQYSGSGTTSSLGKCCSFGIDVSTNPIEVTLIATKNGVSNSTKSLIWCGEDKLINITLDIEKPDITINSSDIYFSPESPKEFQVTTITAVIHNLGNSDVGAEGVADLNISFYKDNLTNLIGSDMIKLAANSQNTASINSTAEAGNHTIFVVADADLKIYESNETNNQANKTINVISDEDFIKKDKVVFKYIYVPWDSRSVTGMTRLTELENIFESRLIIDKSCVNLNCALGNPITDLANLSRAHTNCWFFPPYTMSIGKKSINATGDIDYDKVNYTCNFIENENETFKNWVKNICYQFEVKPNICLSCDLNNDGIAVKDYNELMQAYKCLLGMGANCYDLNGNGITFQEWNEMKHEYECFNGIFN